MMQECDTLLMVGSSFPYSEFLPEEGQARGVQIDIDGRMLGIRYPMEVNLVGDSAETLRALLPRLERKEDRSWRERIEGEVAEWWELMDTARSSAPTRSIRSSSSMSCRSACPTARSSALTRARPRTGSRATSSCAPGMMASLSGTLATMGAGVPYAIAAKFAYPDRPVIALVGDGAMQMNGINELITIAKYREQWPDQRLIVLVLNNRDLNQVTWEQRAMEGDPKFEGSQDLPDFPYAQLRGDAGLDGIRVDTPGAGRPAWDRALAADRPVVYEAVTDPEVPPLPPHITIEQARALSSALLSGDPDSGRIVRQSFKHADAAQPGRHQNRRALIRRPRALRLVAQHVMHRAASACTSAIRCPNCRRIMSRFSAYNCSLASVGCPVFTSR